MGHLRDGDWQKGDAGDDQPGDGRFRRKDSVCRNWITADGARGRAGAAASRPRAAATTSMSPRPAPGRTAR